MAATATPTKKTAKDEPKSGTARMREAATNLGLAVDTADGDKDLEAAQRSAAAAPPPKPKAYYPAQDADGRWGMVVFDGPQYFDVTPAQAARTVLTELLGLEGKDALPRHFAAYEAKHSVWPPHMGDIPLGAPLTDEAEFAVGEQVYVAQGFAGGIVLAKWALPPAAFEPETVAWA